MYKTFTIALLQALTIDISATRALQALPTEVEVDEGLVNITGFAQIDQNGQVRIDVDDLYALDLLLEEYERTNGGEPVCDYEQTWNWHVTNGLDWLSVDDYLDYWFENLDPPHECVTDDYLIWMLDYNHCHCREINVWIYEKLADSDSTFQELVEDIEANRPWMHDSVQRALFDLWDQCFPDQTLDEVITWEDLRMLFGVEPDICYGSHTPDDPPLEPGLCPDGETDPVQVTEATRIDWMFEHWFKHDTIEYEPTDWNCVLKYVFEDTGSHCEIIRDTTADILDDTHLSWEMLRSEDVVEARPWMKPETFRAFLRHWQGCFTVFDSEWQNLYSEEEKRDFSSDDIRNLDPTNTW